MNLSEILHRAQQPYCRALYKFLQGFLDKEAIGGRDFASFQFKTDYRRIIYNVMGLRIPIQRTHTTDNQHQLFASCRTSETRPISGFYRNQRSMFLREEDGEGISFTDALFHALVVLQKGRNECWLDRDKNLGLYSIWGKMSYHQISQNPKPRDMGLQSFDCCEIWQTHRQHNWRCKRQIP